MDLGIKGKRALVLGSSKGLGYATAHTLAGEGADVAVSSSSLERATESVGTFHASAPWLVGFVPYRSGAVNRTQRPPRGPPDPSFP